MTPEQQLTAARCLAAAYDGTMAFPAIVATLHAAGFESYEVDFRRGTSTYFTAHDHVALAIPHADAAIPARFDAAEVAEAVREAQRAAPGYTYAGFCARVKAAGCSGYTVSLLGRRVVYTGRTAEHHVEHFPS